LDWSKEKSARRRQAAATMVSRRHAAQCQGRRGGAVALLFPAEGQGGAAMMKKVNFAETAEFDEKGMKRFLLHDSPSFRILNFNLAAGHLFPVHSHDCEGQLTIQVLAGSGEFLGKDDLALPAAPGDLLICDISEPHGVRAHTQMRILVTIAPPF
jgi:quercetin dioxygenase-like cupin family protein